MQQKYNILSYYLLTCIFEKGKLLPLKTKCKCNKILLSARKSLIIRTADKE